MDFSILVYGKRVYGAAVGAGGSPGRTIVLAHLDGKLLSTSSFVAASDFYLRRFTV